MQTLKDKVVIITGAGGAIAGAVAEGFAKAGARLLLVDRDEVRIAGRASSYNAPFIESELASFDDAQKMVTKAKDTYGKVDGLVHLVGAVDTAGVLEAPLEMFELVFNSNMRTLFYSVKAVLPELLKREEAFIGGIASSEAWGGGAAGASLFAAAKSAVATFLRSLDKELVNTQVGVSIVYPMGPADTVTNRNTLGRKSPFIQPDGIAEAFVRAALSGHGGRLLEIPIYPPRQ
jgi:NADP-dependent 3-hydroxy acid dehydrogenase YdfG